VAAAIARETTGRNELNGARTRPAPRSVKSHCKLCTFWSSPQLGQFCEHSIEIMVGTGIQHIQFQSKRASRILGSRRHPGSGR
jgi:hypothetical protein